MKMDLLDILREVHKEGEKFENWLREIPIVDAPEDFIMFNDLENKLEKAIMSDFDVIYPHDYYTSLIHNFACGDMEKEALVAELKAFNREEFNKDCTCDVMKHLSIFLKGEKSKDWFVNRIEKEGLTVKEFVDMIDDVYASNKKDNK